MLKQSIIHIAAAVAGVLLIAGCTERLDPAQEGTPISFSAESLLLRDDATKSGSPKTGTSFENNDAIAVFGWHKAASELIAFGSTTGGVMYNGSSWSYSPIESWQWQGSTDYYDFLAIYPWISESAPAGTYSSSKLRATVTYDPTSSQYDLMTASRRRLATETNPTSIVPLTFTHRMAAVKVVVKNDTGGQTFRLDACHFRSLIISATATSEFKDGVFNFSWSNTVRSGSDLLGSEPNVDLAASKSSELDYDLMIPQELDPLGSSPSMVLTYSPKTGSSYETAVSTVIPLSQITVQGSSTPIDEWVAGTIYTYNITIRIGGGVVVNVTTTPWEDVEAETPGIML